MDVDRVAHELRRQERVDQLLHDNGADERDDGSQGRFVLCIRFNYAKIKFKAGEPQPAKFYLLCQSGDLDNGHV